jgi:uncharacterized protein (TIGR02246 family)
MNKLITDPAAISAAFHDAINTGDLETAMALFAPDATMRTLSGEIVAGQDLREYNAGTIAGQGHLTYEPLHILTGADTALIISNWTLKVNGPDGNRIMESGRTANVARRADDGTWHIAILNPLGTA